MGIVWDGQSLDHSKDDFVTDCGIERELEERVKKLREEAAELESRKFKLQGRHGGVVKRLPVSTPPEMDTTLNQPGKRKTRSEIAAEKEAEEVEKKKTARRRKSDSATPGKNLKAKRTNQRVTPWG